MERLVRLQPLGISCLVANLHAVFACKVAIEFFLQRFEPLLKLQFVFGGHRAIAFGLALAEGVEGLLEIGCL